MPECSISRPQADNGNGIGGIRGEKNRSEMQAQRYPKKKQNENPKPGLCLIPVFRLSNALAMFPYRAVKDNHENRDRDA